MTQQEQIPTGVYYGTDTGNFYNETTKEGQGQTFYDKWVSRKDDFPQKKTEGIPIQEFAAKSPENASIIAGIVKGLKDGTLVLS